MKKLIFVEGVSGVGKSTTAVKLCEALNSHSYSAVCHLEGDVDNPVDLFSCAYLTKAEFAQLLRDFQNDAESLIRSSIHEKDYVLVRYCARNTAFFSPPLVDALKLHEGFYKPTNPISLECYTQVFADCWRRFLRQDKFHEDYAIFDGCFLYHRANDLMQNYNATNEIIAAHLESLLVAISPYQPLLFYLWSNNVGERLIQARKNRGQTPATDERIVFELERKNRQMKILELLSIKARTLDISSGNWTDVIEVMMSIVTENTICPSPLKSASPAYR